MKEIESILCITVYSIFSCGRAVGERLLSPDFKSFSIPENMVLFSFSYTDGRAMVLLLVCSTPVSMTVK